MKVVRTWWLLWICIFLPFSVSGHHFSFNATCKKAYQAAFKAQFQECETVVRQELSGADQNLCALYVQCFSRFLSTSFQESPSNDRAFLAWLSSKEDLMEEGPEHAFKRFALGEMHLYESMVEMRLDNSLSAAMAVRKTYSLLEENVKKYPDFKLSKKSLYTVQALLSNIPESYRGIAEFFGYQTDQYAALNALDQLQKHLKDHADYSIFRKEVNLYRGIIMLKLTQRYHEGYAIIKESTPEYKTNPVECYIRGKLALDCKKTGEAIDILQHFAGENAPIPYINYDIGTAYFYMLDRKCLLYFSHFLRQTKGPGLIKDTYLKMAWYSYLKHQPEQVDLWLGFIEDHVTSVREKDKVAMQEAKRFDELDSTLLRARIHFDGGFYEYALDLLEAEKERLLKTAYTRLRYYYQAARLHQDMEHFQEALAHFQNVVEEPFRDGEYFIPVAYYQMGIIYEEHLSQKSAALKAYRACLQYDDYPYETSYRYKSKLAIKRLES